MNPPPNSYPYGLPPPGMPFSGPPGVPLMVPPGAPFRPVGVMPPVLPLQRPQIMRPTTLSRPPVLPAPAGTPVIVTPSPRLALNVLPPKSTTLYVGKIAPSVDDSVIKALLEACGSMKSWKRVQDPDTKQLKGFGFCEYEEADGVLKALQLLNNLSLDGQELLLKPNTATEKYIEYLKARKEREAAAAKVKGDQGTTGGTAEEAGAAGEDGAAEEGEDTEASKENAILEKIMAIVSEQASKTSAHKATDQFLSSMKDERGRRRDEDRRARPSRDGVDRAAERHLEAEFAREKERERSRLHERHQELQRAYEERERAWLKHERDAKIKAEKDLEQEKTLQKERARRTRADLEHADSDADEDPWERRPIASSQRAQARKRLREKEEELDAADREAEAQERAAKLQRGESTQEYDSYRENGTSHNSAPADESVHVDVNDPIYQAMIAAAKEQPKPAVLPPPPAISAEQLEQERARQQAQRSTSAASRPSPAPDSSQDTSAQRPSRPPSKPLLSVFGGDDEEDKPKRKLIPLTYTEEEKRAMQEAQAVASPGKAVDTVAAIRKLMDTIPTEPEAVFAYPIKWEAFDKYNFRMAPKLSQWVLRKTAELLGEEEHSMVEYVMKMLKEHVQPAKMIQTLSEVMDNETKPFVHKLYRMVIYETEKALLEE
ncbi:g6714 [Coccomyxa elongata]